MTDKAPNMLPILEFDELVEIFGYTSLREAQKDIRAGKFPVPLFKMARRTVAHVDAVKVYFDERRDESMTWLKRRYGIDPADIAPTEARLDLLQKKREKK